MLFQSFWMAGFESACHVNEAGARLDMIAATQHDRFIREDYQQLLPFGIRTVRDTVRWHLVERSPGVFDFSSVDGQIAAAREHGIQIIWDLCHYGWPPDLDVFSPAFIDRFAAFSLATTRYLRDRTDGVPYFTPINEISFLAWAAGEVGWFLPYGKGRGAELKRQLIRACVAGIEAIWSVEPRARIITVEPVIHVLPPKGQPDVGGIAAAYHQSQFEAWDMLSGLREPELGGHPKIPRHHRSELLPRQPVGTPRRRKIHWHIHPRDSRWVPFHLLLKGVYDRYRRPLLVAETSHVGIGRAEWIREMADEVCLAIEDGVPLEGVCLYPIVDRFEWNDPTHWHNSGLWDYDILPDGTFARVLNIEYATEFRRSQQKVAEVMERITSTAQG